MRNVVSLGTGTRMSQSVVPPTSRHIERTDPSPIYKVLANVASSKQHVLSLAQGVTHWAPPKACLESLPALLSDPSVSEYGPVEGFPPLREALKQKLAEHNGLPEHEVMVTAGANQAFMNVVLSVLGPGDEVVIFVPYYFNHHMALQMTGHGNSIHYGPCDPATLHPDVDWLERALTASTNSIRLVVIVNPCNPSGAVLRKAELERISRLCAAAGAWLLLDETYEDFVFDNEHDSEERRASMRRLETVCAPHVIHVYSFSKAYGLAGWRVGYIAHAGGTALQSALLKVQDTIPINAAQLSQRLALAALRHAGPSWVAERAQELVPARAIVAAALRSALGAESVHGEGAIYFWARLPDGCIPDEEAMAWMIQEHGVSVVYGSSFGSPGFIRVSFANAPLEKIKVGAARLEAALKDLRRQSED